MTALAIYAALDASSASSQCAVTGEASLFQQRSEYTAQSRLISRGFLFGKTELECQPVLLRIVKVPRFHQSRTRQRQTFQSGHPDQKTDPVPYAADSGFHRKLEQRLPWHLHSILHVPAGSGERILNHWSRAFCVYLGIIRRELLGGNTRPGLGHVRSGLHDRDIFVATGAYVAAQITAFAGARERADHQQLGDRAHG